MTAAAWADQQVTAVRDDPAGRLALMQRCYYGPFGEAPRHLPDRRRAVTGGEDSAPIRGYVWAVVFSFAFYAVGLNIAFVLWWLLP